MKYAVFSDIHGNYEAFKACYEDAIKKGITGFIFCGDYITDVLMSNEVVDLIINIQKQYPTYIVRGNREDDVLDYATGRKKYIFGSNEENFLLTYYQLFQKHIDFLINLEKSVDFTINNFKISLSHELKDSKPADVVITGHTHIQSTLYDNGILYVNPGSVGLNGDKRVGATYAIITFDQKVEVDEYFVEYDVNKTIETIKNSLLNNVNCCWDKVTIKVLSTGVNYQEKFIKVMKDLAIKYNYDSSLDNIPKKYWEEALNIIDTMTE